MKLPIALFSVTALALVFQAACTPGIRIDEGGGGAANVGASSSASPSATSSNASSVVASSSSGGCKSASECGDAEPCTDDACGVDAQCTHVAKAAGATGNAAEGVCDGVCQTDGHCGLRLYSRSFPGAGTWSSAPTLSEVWVGTNAPPPRGIVATIHRYLRDDLFVFADDGNVYLRHDGSWQAPTAISTMFPGLTAATIGCVEIFQGNPGDADALVVSATGSTPRLAFGYDLSPSNVVTPNAGNPTNINDTKGGAPQARTDCDYSLSVQTNYTNHADWMVFYRHYADKIWEFNGADFSWDSWPENASPVFSASGSPAPDPTKVLGAYREGSTAYFVAP